MLYATLPQYCKEMTTEELREFFPEGMITKYRTTGKNKGDAYEVPEHFKISFLMRTLIMNELAAKNI